MESVEHFTARIQGWDLDQLQAIWKAIGQEYEELVRNDNIVFSSLWALNQNDFPKGVNPLQLQQALATKNAQMYAYRCQRDEYMLVAQRKRDAVYDTFLARTVERIFGGTTTTAAAPGSLLSTMATTIAATTTTTTTPTTPTPIITTQSVASKTAPQVVKDNTLGGAGGQHQISGEGGRVGQFTLPADNNGAGYINNGAGYINNGAGYNNNGAGYIGYPNQGPIEWYGVSSNEETRTQTWTLQPQGQDIMAWQRATAMAPPKRPVMPPLIGALPQPIVMKNTVKEKEIVHAHQVVSPQTPRTLIWEPQHKSPSFGVYRAEGHQKMQIFKMLPTTKTLILSMVPTVLYWKFLNPEAKHTEVLFFGHPEALGSWEWVAHPHVGLYQVQRRGKEAIYFEMMSLLTLMRNRGELSQLTVIFFAPENDLKSLNNVLITIRIEGAKAFWCTDETQMKALSGMS
ncbi:hypothetical protein BGZ94_000932 [Podila epigama]|nr:hypothetical protein BGZ94_000932 [Podila epigama]